MKIKGFLEDISGIKRITKARLDAIKNAPADPVPEDPIRKVAQEWHPGALTLRVQEIRYAGANARTCRFVRPEGGKLPPFYAGQYLVLTLDVEGKTISRPYSISSAPSEARLENGFVEITVKKPQNDGFFAEHIFRNLAPGDEVTALIGCGQFYFEPLRDARRILALAGGVGVTPFVSMAREIAAGKPDIDLTILEGAVRPEELILADELQALEDACPEKIRVVPVISGDSPGWNGEKGFLSAELIRKYIGWEQTVSADDAGFAAEKSDTSIFVCGPQAMYRYLREELKKLEIPERRVRFEVFGQVKDIASYEGYPEEAAGKTFSLTVHRGIHADVIPAMACESLAVALERAGIRLETACRSGECGFCRTKVLSGPYFVCPENDGRRAADKEFNYVHACSAFPVGDLEIRIPIA